MVPDVKTSRPEKAVVMGDNGQWPNAPDAKEGSHGQAPHAATFESPEYLDRRRASDSSPLFRRRPTPHHQEAAHGRRTIMKFAKNCSEPHRHGSVPATWTAARSAFVVAVACTTGCELPKTGGARAATVVVVTLDASPSTDATSRCAELTARVSPILHSRTRRVDLLVLGTGDRRSGQPRVVVPWTTFVPDGAFLEGASEGDSKAASWLDGVRARCEATLVTTDSSPVFEAVEASASALHARCEALATERYACTRTVLAVHSDLRSNHGAFGRYLVAYVKAKHKKPSPPVALDLGDIELQVCGTVNTSERGTENAAVLEAWKHALGRDIAADPTCQSDIADGAR